MPRRTVAKHMRKNAYPTLKPETRYYNSTVSHTATTTSTTAVNDVPGGTGSSDRTGRKIACKAIEVKLVSDLLTRVVLYSPKQAGQVLSLASRDAPIENDEFWVLMDMYIDPGDRDSLNKTIRQRLTTEFSDTAGTIRRGELYLHCRTAASANVTGFTKLWFVDF